MARWKPPETPRLDVDYEAEYDESFDAYSLRNLQAAMLSLALRDLRPVARREHTSSALDWFDGFAGCEPPVRYIDCISAGHYTPSQLALITDAISKCKEWMGRK